MGTRLPYNSYFAYVLPEKHGNFTRSSDDVRDKGAKGNLYREQRKPILSARLVIACLLRSATSM